MKNSLHVLVARISHVPDWNLPAEHVAALRLRYPQVTFSEADTEDEAAERIGPAAVMVSGSLPAAVLARAERLEWVHTPGSGVDQFLFDAFVQSGVRLTNTRDAQAKPIGEHVFALALALLRKVHQSVRDQDARRYDQPGTLALPELGVLRGRRLGVVGVGAIGGEVARLGKAFNMTVAAMRRRPDAPCPDHVDRVYSRAEIDAFLAVTDVLVLCAPNTSETRGLIGAAELARLPRGAIVINVGRGPLLDEEALAAAVRSGHLRGAGLDVTVEEPLPPSSPLWDLPDIILTPHVSWAAGDPWPERVAGLVENLERFLAGEPLRNVVDKRAGY